MPDFNSYFESIGDSGDEIKKRGEKHDLYKNLFRYLEPCFPSVSNDSIERLSVAGYAYFRFLLMIDSVVDRSGKEEGRREDSSSVFTRLSRGFALHERSVRELAVLFQAHPEFWLEFENIKDVYREAVRTEKALSFKPECYTKSTFEKIAAGKSAVSRAAVLALCTLSGQAERRESLEQMLIRYHQGLQVLDDLDDFRSDVQVGQPTWAIARVNAYLVENGDDPSALEAERKYKYFFVSGIASSLLQEAEAYFEEAIAIARNHDLSKLKNHFEEKIHRCTRHQWEIERLIEKTRSKVQHSNEPARSLSKVDIKVFGEAIQQAVSFLEEKQEKGGLWKDFLTSAGVGTHWVSNYVGYQLAEADLAPELTSRLQSGRTETDVPGAYNETMIQDGDSTTFRIGFRYEKTGAVPKEEAQEWSQYRHGQGGWRTYLDGETLRNRLDLPRSESVKGWLTPKPCVTAASAAILARMPDVDLDVQPTVDRLLHLKEQSSFWRSYWWTSPIYATSFALQALSTYASNSPSGSDSIESSIAQGTQWLRDLQNEDGSWSAGDPSSPLYTALAVKALAEATPQATASIRAGVNWLLQSQRADGSWPTHRVLRIPATHMTDPSDVENWRKSSFGTNVLVDDHQRVFTTATVINALTTAKRVLADN